jgi:glycosyltransferase involved in cell wall biosynthesis
MKVLFAPIHYFYGKNYASEMICAHDIFTRVSKLVPESRAISLFKLDEETDTSHLFYKYLTAKPFYPNFMDNIKLMFFYTFRGLKLIKEQHYSVIHHVFPFRIGRTFNPLFLLTGQNVKKIIGPVMLSVNFENKDISKNNQLISKLVFLFDPLYALLSRMTLSRSDCILALNNKAKQELVFIGVPENKITILPIGIDINKFSFTPFAKKDSKNIELLALGYLHKRKGTELVIKALQLVKKNCPSVHLTIIGDGPQRTELENLASKLDLKKNITFAGFVNYEQLVKYYQKSHILVSMSRAESWGQVYIDAMACGLPIITSKNDGSNEIVVDGKFGYLVDKEDYKALADKTLHLINNFDLMAKLGRCARQEVENKYDWDKAVIPQYINLYKN